MGSTVSLKQDYNEQLSFYPKLSKEEIVALYESEGITTETIDEVISKLTILINNKNHEIDSIKNDMAANRLINSIFLNDEETVRINKLQQYVNTLEQKAKELQYLHNQMLELLPAPDHSSNSIEATIEQLNREISNKKQEIAEEKSQNDNLSNNKANQKIINLETELEQLNDQVSKLKYKYKNHVHKLYISTRGVLPRDRNFPSLELRNKIAGGTLGLARYWAKRYYYESEKTVPFDDLNQIAHEALLSAAHYYIPSDRANFYTYAAKCIKNKLRREINEKKKMKPRSYKPNSFFEREKDLIKYAQMFLEALKVRSRSGKTYYYSTKKEETPSVILFRLKEKIVSFNRDVRFREESHRMLKSFTGKRTLEKFNEIVERIITFINNSKMKILISDEDRDLTSSLVNHQNRPQDLQEIYLFCNYLDIYLYKLCLIEKYFSIEHELTSKNHGITPTDEEILKEFNKKIKADNQERYKLKKAGFFDKDKPYFKWYHDFYTEYKTTYNVDPFISSEDYDWNEYSSKKKERDDIAADFEEDERLSTIDHLIDRVEYFDDMDKVVLTFSDDDSQVYEDWEEYDEDEEYDTNNCEILSREEALEKLRAVMTSFPDLDEEAYVKQVLQERKDKVNAILKEKNAPLVEENRQIKKQRDQYDLGKRYQRQLRERELTQIKKDIELLYGTDDELFILINSGRNKDRRQHDLSTEDEALNNVFMAEFYKLLEDLPELEREVMLKCFDEQGRHGMTAKEVGTALGISEGKVYKAKTKALKMLSANKKLQSYMEEE